MYLPVLMCSTYFWCSMRFHKCVSACISVYYVFLVQYALDPGFTRPQELISGGPAPNFTQLRLLSLSFLISPCCCHCCRPLSLQFCSKQQQRPQEVALSACLGLACLSKNVSPLLLLKKENLPMCVFRYLPSYVSLLDWTISGQAASLSRIGILGSG